MGILTNSLQSNVTVSGLTDTAFPKVAQASTDASLNTQVSANAGSTAGNNASAQEVEIRSSVKKLDDFALSTVYRTEYINEIGSSDMNEITESYNLLSESKKTEYRESALQSIRQTLKVK